ncbi:S1 family peptidase [Scleromatobacter humisilvae]|uniref:Serine protease n=1 Tax=Scleromatobacter humisilvae TaxID=2897159 RepID=A0A9X1YGT4_9BURK|nr:serine protease [Scleromatobacter humisilvae]MCK9684580.1 serine protease [Scleromatobacter humisilvae]
MVVVAGPAAAHVVERPGDPGRLAGSVAMDGRQQVNVRRAGSRWLAALCGLVLLAALHPPARAARLDDAQRLVVMIETRLGGRTHQGAGIVFSVAGDTAYAFTADHLVRDPSAPQGSTETATRTDVYFKDLPRTPIAAKVLPAHDLRDDIAVIEIRGLHEAGLDGAARLPFELITGSSALPQRTEVYPVGYPGGLGWGMPLRPDLFDRRESDRILFQSDYVHEGHSGGGLFTADGHLVGMILAVAQAPTVAALPVESALEFLRRSGFSVGVQEAAGPSATTLAASPAAARPGDDAAIEDEGADGRIFLRRTRWGGFGQDGDERWIRISISRISGLPKGVFDGWFNGVEMMLLDENRREHTFGLSKDLREVVSSPLPVDGLGDVRLRVQSHGFISRKDITQSQQLSLRQLQEGQVLRLPYTDNVLAELPQAGGTQEVRMFVKAVPFSPDEHSGPDRNEAGASPLLRGSLVQGKVDFDAGNATDHLVVAPASGGDCRGVAWVGAIGEATLASSLLSSGEPSARRIVSDRYTLTKMRSQPAPFTQVLYDLRCEQKAMLRVQAGDVGAQADYAIYVGTGRPDAKALGALVGRWLDAWVSPTFFDQRESFDIDKVQRGIALLGHATSTRVQDLALVYEDRLEHSATSTLLEHLIAAQRDELEAALATCCAAASALRFELQLLRAEAGLPFDRRPLQWGVGEGALVVGSDQVERAKAVLGSAR